MELRLQPVYLTQMTHHPLILPSLVSITLIELRNGITPKNPVADTKKTFRPTPATTRVAAVSRMNDWKLIGVRCRMVSFGERVGQAATLSRQHFHAGFESAGALYAIDVDRHMPMPKCRDGQSDG